MIRLSNFETDTARERHLEKAMFALWRKESGETNDLWLEHLKNCISVGISETLTEKQRYCIGLYLSGYNQREISRMSGLSPSTVSRHISRGLNNLLSRIKYATPATLRVEAKVRQNLTRLYN